MNYNYDLSVIVPGIRNEHWETIYDQLKVACKRFSYELIFVGPSPLPERLQKDFTVKYIKDFGTPTRALHIGTVLAEGKYFTWLSDDAHLYPDSVDNALETLLQNNPEKDIVCVRYTEGPGHCGAEFPMSYWVAGTHPDLRAPGVNPDWKIPCVMMLASARYRELGGLDCRFEHINMNVHDLAFRAQRDGTVVHMSPTQVMNCDFETGRTVENSAVIAAFWENDRPLFWQLYGGGIDDRPIKIDIENWRASPPVWARRKR